MFGLVGPEFGLPTSKPIITRDCAGGGGGGSTFLRSIRTPIPPKGVGSVLDGGCGGGKIKPSQISKNLNFLFERSRSRKVSKIKVPPPPKAVVSLVWDGCRENGYDSPVSEFIFGICAK